MDAPARSRKSCDGNCAQRNDEAADQAEGQALEEADYVETVVAVAGHPFGAGQHDPARLPGGENQEVEHQKVVHVEGQQRQEPETSEGTNTPSAFVGLRTLKPIKGTATIAMNNAVATYGRRRSARALMGPYFSLTSGG